MPQGNVWVSLKQLGLNGLHYYLKHLMVAPAVATDSEVNNNNIDNDNCNAGKRRKIPLSIAVARYTGSKVFVQYIANKDILERCEVRSDVI